MPSRWAKASCQGLVDSTSMRCANNTATSRCTCAWCCNSSMALTRSANAFFKLAKGSRDKGAPALAASRCHAMASARLMRSASRSASPVVAHACIRASWSLALRASSSFSRTNLAAPLSRWLISVNTACNCSCSGWLANHWLSRVARSLAVAAVKAPPVRASRAFRSCLGVWGFEEAVTGQAHGQIEPNCR